MAASHGILDQGTQILAFARFIFSRARTRTVLASVFLLLGGLTEGLSILVLVPLLALLRPGETALTLPLPPTLVDATGLSTLTLTLPVILGVLVGLVIVQSLLMRAKTIYMADLLSSLTNNLRLVLFDAIASARWRFLVGTRLSDLRHALTTDIEHVHVAINNLLALIQALVLLAIYTGASLIISPMMTLCASVFGVAFLVILTPLRRYASAHGELMGRRRQAQARTVSQFLDGLKVIKSLNAEPRYIDVVGADLTDLRMTMVRYMRVATLSGVLFQTLSVIAAAVFIYLALVVARLELSRIVVLIFLFMRISPRFTAVQSHVQDILMNMAGYREVERLVAACEREREPAGRPGQARLTLDRALSFRDVEFGYGSSGDARILSGVSFQAPAGKITAIIGPSGGGKSTIADLMLGLLEPGRGSVAVDGVVLDDALRRRWRDQVAYVPQDVFLLHDTIAANLRLAAPDADDDALWLALEQAQAAGFVRTLVDGLATVVGERGARLSGGERQRIALARALLSRPVLLILDEATSALDWENQNLIAAAIAGLRGGMTVVTIAHRPSMIAFADWVVAVENGRVVETGAFDAMAARRDSSLARLLFSETASA